MSETAIYGEQGGYVPCKELAAALPASEVGAIVGSGVGYVAKDQGAAALPAGELGAIVGSGVGFVANPCVIPPPFVNAYQAEQQQATGGPFYVTGGSSDLHAFLADYSSETPGAQPLESDVRLAVNVVASSEAISAGASDIRIRAKMYSRTLLPPNYAVVHDWVIWRGTWPGDEFSDPDYNDVGGTIDSGTIIPNGPNIFGSLAGADVVSFDFLVPFDIDGIARFVLGFGTQANVNGSDGVSILSTPRYPGFVGNPVNQSDAFLWFQYPADTTASSTGYRMLTDYVGI